MPIDRDSPKNEDNPFYHLFFRQNREVKMKIKDIWFFAVIALVIWTGISIADPFWEKYWLEQEMDRAAIYGTKHSIKATEHFLTDRMKHAGYDFTGEDFEVKKDSDNDVTVSITYSDEIKIFGLCLKSLEFTVEKASANIREYM